MGNHDGIEIGSHDRWETAWETTAHDSIYTDCVLKNSSKPTVDQHRHIYLHIFHQCWAFRSPQSSLLLWLPLELYSPCPTATALSSSPQSRSAKVETWCGFVAAMKTVAIPTSIHAASTARAASASGPVD